MPYVAQLLPNLEEARVLRKALAKFVEREDITEEERDNGWAMLAKLTEDMRRKR